MSEIKNAVKTLADLDFAGKKVLVRVDFNVPLDDDSNITDDTRIVASLPTIDYLRGKGAAVILMSHLGRPKGQVNPKYSLRPVANYLKNIYGEDVFFADDCIGEEAQELAKSLKTEQLLLLENLRFYAEEEANDSGFAAKLAKLADIYVNDAFGTAHRSHASTVGVTDYLPGCVGLLLEEEVKTLASLFKDPKRPFVSIIGGAKISDKIAVIEHLLSKVDRLLIGGGMANTFLAAQGYNMQKSLYESEKIDWAKELLAMPEAKRLILPVDLVVAEKLEKGVATKDVYPDSVPDGYMALDIGPGTVRSYSSIIKDAGTIVWNGPMGAFEVDEFSNGTVALAKAVADAGAFSIVGGGDSVSAIQKAGVEDKIDHISTGGGATLKFLEGKTLPAIAALAK